jgi:hypothetical protein
VKSTTSILGLIPIGSPAVALALSWTSSASDFFLPLNGEPEARAWRMGWPPDSTLGRTTLDKWLEQMVQII